MASKLLYLAFASVLVAYYVYTPLPEGIEQSWKVMFIDVMCRTQLLAIELSDTLGLRHYLMLFFLSGGSAPPLSDENVTVTDTRLNNVPVRVYVPRKSSSALKRALIYFHGGGWHFGSPSMQPYDLLSRWIAQRLNAVVVSIDYRLAPTHRFPAAFEDSYAATKFFLQKEILDQYNVDPERVCLSGDSAGGNLAAAVTQQLQEDPAVKVKPKVQALIYPALQTVDLDTPSHRENSHMPVLSKRNMVKFWSGYFTADKLLCEAMSSNTHISSEQKHLIKFANWSNLLPEELKKDHVYRYPQHGQSEMIKIYPGIIDPRAAPLLVDDAKMSKLPLTYILTCMHDVLRDDGFMYAARLKQVGVQVVHDHYDHAFHGMLSFITGPAVLSLGLKMVDNYINWLNENL